MDRDDPGRNGKQHGRRQDTAGATPEEKRQGLAEQGVAAPHPEAADKRSPSTNDNKA